MLIFLSALITLFSLGYCFWLGILYHNDPNKASLLKVFYVLSVSFAQYGFANVLSGKVEWFIIPFIAVPLLGLIILTTAWCFVKLLGLSRHSQDNSSEHLINFHDQHKLQKMSQQNPQNYQQRKFLPENQWDKPPTTLFGYNNSSETIFEFRRKSDGLYSYSEGDSLSLEYLADSGEWSTFAKLSEAQRYRQSKAHSLARLEDRKASLKQFRLQVWTTPSSQLKQAIFAITGNKKFLEETYDPLRDDMILSRISSEEIKELIKILKS